MSSQGLFGALDVSSSGLSAERTRLNIIANNIANINTTRTEDGGPYRRQEPVFETVLQEAAGEGAGGAQNGYTGAGVRVSEIRDDHKKPLKVVFDPHHPDADEAGYVSLPNVNVTEEMVDMISASRAYEANIAVVKTTKDMLNQSLEIK